MKRQKIEKKDSKTKNCFSKQIVSFFVLYSTLLLLSFYSALLRTDHGEVCKLMVWRKISAIFSPNSGPKNSSNFYVAFFVKDNRRVRWRRESCIKEALWEDARPGRKLRNLGNLGNFFPRFLNPSFRFWL